MRIIDSFKLNGGENRLSTFARLGLLPVLLATSCTFGELDDINKSYPVISGKDSAEKSQGQPYCEVVYVNTEGKLVAVARMGGEFVQMNYVFEINSEDKFHSVLDTADLAVIMPDGQIAEAEISKNPSGEIQVNTKRNGTDFPVSEEMKFSFMNRLNNGFEICKGSISEWVNKYMSSLKTS